MRVLFAIVLLLASACGAANAGAQQGEIRRGFARKFPQLTVESVRPLGVLGLWEVVASGEIYYVDPALTHVVVGEVVALENMRSLTRERKREISAIPWDSLPHELAFTRVKGKGTRHMAVFTDPDCPYCRRLEQELLQVDDVTLHIFLFPIPSLHPAAPDVAKRVWCSADRVRAWDDYMLRQVRPTATNACDTPVDRIAAYAERKGITGTPTLVFANGERVPGVAPARQLEEFLNAK
ncbi:MAG: DsbC family protein [Gemmatimonadales bacterium]|nr:DsbC family protein [Gemmatimonadales bacterium]